VNRLLDEELGFHPQKVQGSECLFAPTSRLALEAYPSLLYNAYQEDLFPGEKWSGCEADHSPPSSAEVKNVWCYTSTQIETVLSSLNYRLIYSWFFSIIW
jgi:hypothetical protein